MEVGGGRLEVDEAEEVVVKVSIFGWRVGTVSEALMPLYFFNSASLK